LEEGFPRREMGLQMSARENSESRQMLVLGYQGTLQLDPSLCQATGTRFHVEADRTVVPGVSPPWIEKLGMEMLVDPLLADALLEITRRIPALERVFGGEQIPLDSLLGLLRERLRGILMQAIAACSWTGPATADRSTLSMQRDLIQKFPVLFPLLEHAVSEWAAATAAFHGRLHRDGARLATWLGMAAMPPIESVSGTASDTHPGGHMVLRIVFTGGRCLYYKPRPVTGEWLWQRLLECIAEAEPALRLPAGRVLAGSPARYGWAESVLPLDGLAAESPNGDAEGSGAKSAYWHAAGAILCLAQHARLTDLHLGNIIATPNGPAVTDAECLGTPKFFASAARGHSRGETEPGAFLDSLLETGLLPRNSARDMPDISGLFGTAEPVPGIGLPQWVLDQDGGYHLTSAPATLVDHGNASGPVSALAVLPQILSGYRQAAGALSSIRKALIAQGAHWRLVLERAHAPRVVLRDTLAYGILLSQSLEPESLRSRHRRQSTLLHALRTSAPGDFAEAVLRTELHALLQLHVPRLITVPGTRTLASGSERSLVPSFAACTPAEAVIRQMEGLSPETLEAVQIPALLLAILNVRNSNYRNSARPG
jgi:lantibiotic modifying enzyme